MRPRVSGIPVRLELEALSAVSMSTMSLTFPDADAAVVMIHDSLGQRGPVSRRELARQLQSSVGKLEGHFWYEGLSDWLLLSQHPELFQGLEAPFASSLTAEVNEEASSAEQFGDMTLNPEYSLSEDWDKGQSGATEPPGQGALGISAQEVASTQPIMGARESSPTGTSGDWMDFASQLQQTWSWDDEWSFSTQVDEVFIGALIASTLKNGYSLMEISSDGTHHHLRFEHVETASRLVCRVTYLTDTLPVAKVLGHRASVIFGYGERLTNCPVDEPLAEPERFGLDGMPAPGTLVIRGEETSGYIYSKVELTLDISRFVHEDYSVNTDLLSEQILVITKALEGYLRHRAN